MSISQRQTGVIERFALRLRGGDAQLRYLSQSIRMEEAVTPHIVRATIALVAGAIAGFVAWAALTQVSEVAKASGSIRPAGHVQTVQHLEGGIVDTLAVSDGDMVRKGQLLVKVKDTDAERDLAELRVKQLSLRLQAERLRAYVGRRPPSFGQLATQHPDLVAEQGQILEGMKNALETERDVVDSQIRQKDQLVDMLSSRAATLDRSVAITKGVRDTKKALLDKGLTTRAGFLAAEQDFISLSGERGELRIRIIQARQEILEFKNRLKSLDASYRDRALRELGEVEADMRQNSEAIAKRIERVRRLEVRAPADGLVKGLRPHTIGEVVGRGETLMEIVPTGEDLIAQVRIEPKDIGHVDIGQSVRIKVSAYDFARYGAIDGVLKTISATTFTDERGRTYYLGEVPIARTFSRGSPRNDKILPGMTVEADIVTGGKTILAYLLKPIHTSLNSALTER